MPELIVYRKNTAPRPMVCMYCGAPGSVVHEWDEENHRLQKGSGGDGGGTDLVVPTGDDPVSLVVGILLLPVALWQLLVALVRGVGAVVGLFTRPATPPSPPPPPKPPLTTRVVITACERHRRFRDKFVWAGGAMVVALVALWVWAVLVTARSMGTENVGLATTLMLTAVFATVLLPIGLSAWYFLAGPVVVDRVTESEVILDRVREPYFVAAGLKKAG